MRAIASLILLGFLSFARGEESLSSIERISRDVPRHLVGKTLWEIGLIEELKVTHNAKGYFTDHEALFEVLHLSKITPRSDLNVSIASDLPPRVEITYEDGTIVSANRYDVVVTLSEGERFFCFLVPPEKPPERIQADFLQLRFEEGFQSMDLKVQIGEHEILGDFSPSDDLGLTMQWTIPRPEAEVDCIISSLSSREDLKWQFTITVSEGKYLWFNFSEGKLFFAQLRTPFWLYGGDVSNKASILTPDTP